MEHIGMDYENITYKEKIDGQTLIIEFCCIDQLSKNTVYYWVSFGIYNKRRNQIHDNYLKATGKIGLQGLVWAKKMIKKFIDEFHDPYIDNAAIIIKGDDKRRNKIYEWGLKDLGFYNKHITYGKHARKVLYKRIKGSIS